MKRTLGRSGVLVCVLAMGLARPVWAMSLLVDDFDRGEKPNALGGDFGSWDKDPSDPTQKCTMSFDQANAFGALGYSLKLDYDVDSPNPAYNGFWMKLQHSDLSSYKTLTLYIKGDATKGFTPQIRLELKNGAGEVGRYLLKGITGEWQQVRIPLEEFSGLTSLSDMTEFVVVFDDMTSTKKVGTIDLDEITFEG